MILICPPAIVEWNASEEINAESASIEAYCALHVSLDKRIVVPHIVRVNSVACISFTESLKGRSIFMGNSQ